MVKVKKLKRFRACKHCGDVIKKKRGRTPLHEQEGFCSKDHKQQYKNKLEEEKMYLSSPEDYIKKVLSDTQSKRVDEVSFPFIVDEPPSHGFQLAHQKIGDLELGADDIVDITIKILKRYKE